LNGKEVACKNDDSNLRFDYNLNKFKEFKLRLANESEINDQLSPWNNGSIPLIYKENIIDVPITDFTEIKPYLNYITHEQVICPVVRGTDCEKQPFIIVRFVGDNGQEKVHFMQTFSTNLQNTLIYGLVVNALLVLNY
jgi:hypothetical protein